MLHCIENCHRINSPETGSSAVDYVASTMPTQHRCSKVLNTDRRPSWLGQALQLETHTYPPDSRAQTAGRYPLRREGDEPDCTCPLGHLSISYIWMQRAVVKETKRKGQTTLRHGGRPPRRTTYAKRKKPSRRPGRRRRSGGFSEATVPARWQKPDRSAYPRR